MTEQIADDMSDPDDPSHIPPLTRNGYTRLPKTEADILALNGADRPTLLTAFAESEEGRHGYRAAEAMVFFIRQFHRDGNAQVSPMVELITHAEKRVGLAAAPTFAIRVQALQAALTRHEQGHADFSRDRREEQVLQAQVKLARLELDSLEAEHTATGSLNGRGSSKRWG